MTPSQVIALDAKNKMADFMSKFITDDELRERGVPEIDIDRLNHKVETQMLSVSGRDRKAVEAALGLDHEQR